MIKEFDIGDILNAVNSISKKEKNNSKNVEKKDFVTEEDTSSPNSQAKSNKSDILVLNQMIE